MSTLRHGVSRGIAERYPGGKEARRLKNTMRAWDPRNGFSGGSFEPVSYGSTCVGREWAAGVEPAASCSCFYDPVFNSASSICI